jgi:flavin-dependent dehydrogenase
MTITARCQVLVAGGGPAGMAAAIALAERKIDVVVIDPDAPVPALSRCEMLPFAAGEILDRLGLSQVLEASVALQGVISLWDTPDPVDHAAAMPGLSGFGWSVDRHVLDAALRQRALALGVRLQTGRVRQIDGQPHDWSVTLDGGASLAAHYLVDATGRPASIARRLGAAPVFGPDLIAITCNVAQVVQPNLLSEARPDGWWYSVPRHNAGGSIGFLTANKASAFAADILTKAGHGLRLVRTPVNPTDICVSDSRMSRLRPTADTGWLATGDAAAAFDPIASQGLFNALSSGFFVGNAAADTTNGDPDAPKIYAAMIERTAARTHIQTPHQYATLPFDTPFWQGFATTGRHLRRKGADMAHVPAHSL